MDLDCERQYKISDIVHVSHQSHPQFNVTDPTKKRIRDARQAFEQLRSQEVEIYGTTTGFGALVDHGASPNGESQGNNLINHLGAGTGDIFAPQITRGAMILRAITLARGYSGIRPKCFDQYINLIQSGMVPAVPKTGSVGASGDLIPMANVAMALRGDGQILDPNKGKLKPAREFFQNCSVDSLEMKSRDALAIVNGVPFCASLAVHSIAQSMKLLNIAEHLTAWAYGSLGCSKEALSVLINNLKGHPEQTISAERLRTILSEKTYNHTVERPLQEPYSLRAAPQIYGAVRKQCKHAQNTVIDEINGVDDNPVIDADSSHPTVAHGANFMSQNLAFAMDNLNQALTQIGNIIEKQLAILLDPGQNNGLEKMLTPNPGAHSGLAGAQINATALLSEMRNNCQSYATSSLPTNGQNQDVVPMGLEAGKNCYRQTDRLGQLLAIMGMSLVQYDWLYEQKKGENLSNKPDWFPNIKPLETDRPLRAEIKQIAEELVDDTTVQ